MKKKALFIGGTGTISTAITARVAAEGEQAKASLR